MEKRKITTKFNPENLALLLESKLPKVIFALLHGSAKDGVIYPSQFEFQFFRSATSKVGGIA